MSVHPPNACLGLQPGESPVLIEARVPSTVRDHFDKEGMSIVTAVFGAGAAPAPVVDAEANPAVDEVDAPGNAGGGEA